MKFQFSLASVLRLRALLESQQRAVLEQGIGRLTNLDNRILEAKHASSERDLAHLNFLTSNGMQGAELHFTTLQARRSLKAIASMCESRNRLAAEVDKYRSKYLALKRDFDVVNSLYEQVLEQYRCEQSRREQAAVDELYLARLERCERENYEQSGTTRIRTARNNNDGGAESGQFSSE